MDYDSLYQLCVAIADVLGPQWKVAGDDSLKSVCYIQDVDDPYHAISIRRDGNNRLKISGLFRLPMNGTCYNGLDRDEKRAAITVSADRPAKQIALDIQRRLLPLYERQYAINKAYVEEANRKEQEKGAVNAKVRDLLNQWFARRSQKPYVYAQVKEDASITANIVGLSFEQFRTMAEVLRKMLEQDSE